MGGVVITGANRGIGYELARHYRRQGRHVIALCRTMSCDLAATGARIVEGIDLGNDGAIQKAASALQDAEIDLLVNNAGFRSFESLGEMSASRIEQQITVNAIAPLMLVDAHKTGLPGGKIVMNLVAR
ncbi:MAG: SDR family NAD(P)-dependent oxidoreductase [Altererythrobacter sp.]